MIGAQMGTIHRLPRAQGVALGDAVDAYLANILGGAERAGTRRVFGRILGRMRDHFGQDLDVADVEAAEFASWFGEQWSGRAPSTYNTALDAVRSAARYWTDQRWIAADPSRMLARRKVAEDKSRALSRAEVERLLTNKKASLRDRTLWTMLYETAARSGEVLSLDVEDLDFGNHTAHVTRKGGARDTIVWQTGTANLLRRLLKGRTSGPIFVTERRARVQLPACDLDADGHARLGYQQAELSFKKASGGATLHQLRHSALTHDAERGTSTPMLMARSGHTSTRSLVRYARVSVEALQRHQAETDPASRRYHH
jgi:integrase